MWCGVFSVVSHLTYYRFLHMGITSTSRSFRKCISGTQIKRVIVDWVNMQKGLLQAPGRRVVMEESISQVDRMQKKKKREDNK